MAGRKQKSKDMEVPLWKKNVINFDPAELYSRISINPFKRRQTVGMDAMWPTIEKGICACGCGSILTGKQRRCASDDCRNFAVAIHQIIAGDPNFVDRYLSLYIGNRNCNVCNRKDGDCPPELYRDNWSFIQKDHIIPVHKGGGGCWLDNYQYLCDKCHKEKSKKEIF